MVSIIELKAPCRQSPALIYKVGFKAVAGRFFRDAKDSASFTRGEMRKSLPSQ
jgi:hypothetical protein